MSTKWQGALQQNTTAKGVTTVNSTHNIHLILSNDPSFVGKFRYNTFAQTVEVTAPEPWNPMDNTPAKARTIQDHDIAIIKRYLSTCYEFEAKATDIEAQLRTIARNNSYDPLVDYLRGLKWDGATRLDDWLVKYFGVADSVYAHRVSRMWPISAVARALVPGCKVDTMLIADGDQGLLKSTAFEVLAGKEFFADTDTGDVGSKDSLINLQGVWIKEAPEMQSVRKADVEKVKAFLSSRQDKFRLPYDRFDSKIPRRVVVVGTTNADAYLQDETGGRRFWPVVCTKIDLEGLREVRDQFWAEAVVRFDAGEKHWISRDDKDYEHFIAAARAKTETDAWEGLVEEYLSRAKEPVITREEVLLYCLEMPTLQWDSRASNRLGRIMKSLGWSRKQSIVPDGTKWFYVRPNIEPSKEHYVVAQARRVRALDVGRLEGFERADAIKKDLAVKTQRA